MLLPPRPRPKLWPNRAAQVSNDSSHCTQLIGKVNYEASLVCHRVRNAVERVRPGTGIGTHPERDTDTGRSRRNGENVYRRGRNVYATELLPYIKLIADRAGEPGLFWLTGSQQFHLMKGVSESLAGQSAPAA